MGRNKSKRFGKFTAPNTNEIPAFPRMLGLTALGLGISKAVKVIRKGVAKRRKIKFGYTQDIGGPEARAVRRDIRKKRKLGKMVDKLYPRYNKK